MPQLCPARLPSTDSKVRDRVRILEERVARLLNATGGDITPSDVVQPALPTPSASATPHPVQGVARTNGGGGDQDHDHDQEDYHRYAEFKVDSPGLFRRSSTSVTYAGSAHWMAILEAIPCLNEVLNDTGMTEPTAGYGDTGMQRHQKMDLLLPSCKTPDKAEILAALPPKETVDILMAECILHTSQEPMIVHAPTFYKDYAEFWADPSSASTMWLGLLFALMTLGVQYQQFTPNRSQQKQPNANAESEPPETEQMVKKYREKTIECLLLSKYINGPPYALQTLLLLIFGDFTRGDSTENVNGLWVLWGTIVQIALRSGYHRDGAHFFPSLTPFEVETRRRIWAIMLEWDMYVSVSFGLPRNINPQQCDTVEPRNLRDEDLYVDMTELPPPRPDSEYTRPQYHNDMNRLMQVLSDISDATCTATGTVPPLSKVTRLDNALNNVYHQISARWAPTASMGTINAANPDADSDTDPCNSVQFTFMTLMYLRAKITLHRKFLFQGRRRRGVPVHIQYQESRNTCLEAALAMLQHQWSLYLQTRVGGPLCRDSRKLLTPLVPDFLLATAVLCAELAMDLDESKTPADASASACASLAGGSGSGGTGSGHGNGAGAGSVNVTNDSNCSDDMPDRVFHALSSAYIVWLYENDAEASRGVKMIVAALNHLLGKAQIAGYGTWKGPLSFNRPSWVGKQQQQQQQQQQQHPSPARPEAQAQEHAQHRYGHGHDPSDHNPNSPAVVLDTLNTTTTERGEAAKPPQRQVPYSGIGNFPI
ncbi:Zn(2)-C6 fungal-type transcription factor mpsB [Exophiala dermatitidis]